MARILFIAVLLFCVASIVPQEGYAAPQSPLFSVGERLHYRGYIYGWIPVGDAWFEVNRDVYRGISVYRFDARALGRYLIYTLDIRLSSFVGPNRLRSLAFRRREVGTEKREYKVIFDRKNQQGIYRRKPGTFTSVEEMDAAPWETRSKFPLSGEVNDILYTLYFARNIGDKVGDKRYYSFVEKDYIWKALVSITDEKRITIGRAGTFDALKIAIEPDYRDQPEIGENFSGLFGVQGSLELWVDKKTRIPLIVRGVVPFTYLFHPTVSVILRDSTLSAPGEAPPPAGVSG
ncbi:MAG: DUF3108 domain-containing protein [Candidatus Aureabacteria bacterium]|nr:DUF3108 domain-containing protein [Candidatus Auribacterota bacterium]